MTTAERRAPLVCPRLALFAVLLGASGCGIRSGTWQDEPSVVSVYVIARSDGERVTLEIASTRAEGDWSYGAFPQSRLDGLVVSTLDGAPVQTGIPSFTPASDHGGTLLVPLPALAAGVQQVKVVGEFVGLDEGGAVVMRQDFDEVVPLRP